MRILVTGGAGFIGSHLVRRLLADGNDVMVLDNYYTGRARNLPVPGEFPHGRLETIQGDVTEFYPASSLTNFQQIYNLACPASPRHYQRNPVDTLRTSVIGADNMLQLARRTGARILQASTSEVYGDPLVHPQTEDYFGNVDILSTRACYDEGKRAAETLFMDYRRQYGVQIRIARIFNTYGPMMHTEDGRVVSNFIVQALRGERMTVYGDGHQTRSLCYITDMVDGLVRLMNANPSDNVLIKDDDDLSTPVNLGNPHEIMVGSLAALVDVAVMNALGTNKGTDFDHKPLPEADPKKRRPDITLARELLDWEPKVHIEDGLKLTVEYFRDILAKRSKSSDEAHARPQQV